MQQPRGALRSPAGKRTKTLRFPARALLAAAATCLAANLVLPQGEARLRDTFSGIGSLGRRGGRPLRHIARARGGAEDAAEAEEDFARPMSEASVYITEVDPISGDVDTSGLPKEMGVYAVFNEDDKLQYIGLSRDIAKSVTAHAEAMGIQDAGILISSVHCLEMPGQSKEALMETWKRWIKEHTEGGGEIPAGNLPENAAGAEPRWRSRAASTKPQLDLAGVRGITSMQEAYDAVSRAVKEHPVVLFMKGSPAMPQCGFSARASGMLRDIGVPYDSVNVLDEAANPGVRDAVKKFGNWPTIPQLYVGGELLGGADIISEMFASGDLKAELQKAVAGQGTKEEADAPESGAQEEAAPRAMGNVELVDDPGRPTATAVSRALDACFQLQSLRIVDESSQNEGDQGALAMGLTSESHFRVEIVAPEFVGLSPVQRQQKVFDALAAVMPRIHALSLVTKAPAEDPNVGERKSCVEELKAAGSK